jgi:hypothetical protein
LLIEQLEKFEGEAQLPSPDRFGRQKLYGLPPVPPYRVIGRVQQLSEAVENILQGNIRALGITVYQELEKPLFCSRWPTIQIFKPIFQTGSCGRAGQAPRPF